MNFRIVVYPVAVASVLAGCGSGGPIPPTSDDIKGALQEGYERVIGKGPLANPYRVTEVKDMSCVVAPDKPGFLCTYTATVTVHSAVTGKDEVSSKAVKDIRFVKGTDKWTFCPPMFSEVPECAAKKS